MCACVKPCRCTASVNWMAFCVITVFVSTREIARIPPVSPAKVNKPAPLRKKTDCIFPHVNMTNNSDVRFPKGICDLCVRSRIGKPRFWGKTQAGWKYDVSAGCRRDASWTCLEGQIAFVPRLIKSPVIIALQRMSGGGGWTKSDSGAVLIYTNVDDIHHIFLRATGLWGDRVMTTVMAAIWSEGFFFSALFTKLCCEAR